MRRYGNSFEQQTPASSVDIIIVTTDETAVQTQLYI